jgi:hypothetical protein
MYISRLLVLCLLIALCVAPVAAQSSAESNSAFSPPGTTQRVVELPPNAQDIPRYSLLRPAFPVEGLKLPDTMPATAVQERESGVIPRLEFRVPRPPILVQNDEACYTIRSYRVTRDDPRSDSTRLAGYSTCQRAVRFQVKEAVDSLEVVPR